MNRETDLMYKKQLERDLRSILRDERYSEAELVRLLELDKRQAHKAFRQIRVTEDGMDTEEVIKRLLGGRYYL